MPEIPVYDHDTVLAAVSPAEAIERVRDGFVAYAHGDWEMPAKVYVQAPRGDFRAMPAQGGGLAILKWITSFPGNPERGLPVVQGVICVSRAETGEPLALIDARAVTALRTGAVAAVAAQELAREDAAQRRASSAAASTAAGRRAAWPPPSTGRASASTPIPTPRARWPASLGLGGRRPRGRAGLRHRHLRHAGTRAGRRARPTCAPACT